MQGRWNTLAKAALAMTLFAAWEAKGSEILPRYTITDLGPYQASIGGSPRFDASGNPSFRYGNPSEGAYSVGLIYDPDRPSYFTGTYLRKEGSNENLLSADLRKLTSAFNDVSGNGEVVGSKALGATYPFVEPFYFNAQTGEQLVMKSVNGSYDYPTPTPFGINDLHQIVGTDNRGDGIFYADPHATPVLLSALVNNLGDWQLGAATDIDNQGRIIGYGIRNDLANNRGHYFRLDPIPTPVPEPTSVVLFLAAAGLIHAHRRRPTPPPSA